MLAGGAILLPSAAAGSGLLQGGLGAGGDSCFFTSPLPWSFRSLRKERGPLDLSVPYLALGLALACLFPFLWNQEWNEHWLGNLDSKTARAISSPLVFLRKQKKTKQYLLNLTVPNMAGLVHSLRLVLCFSPTLLRTCPSWASPLVTCIVSPCSLKKY